jgi:hypothetical protein
VAVGQGHDVGLRCVEARGAATHVVAVHGTRGGVAAGGAATGGAWRSPVTRRAAVVLAVVWEDARRGRASGNDAGARGLTRSALRAGGRWHCRRNAASGCAAAEARGK